MPIRALLMDIDDTLFDFQTSSRNALSIVFRAFGLPFTPEMWERYRALDAELWQRFERGEITKEALYVERFRVFFAEYGLERPTRRRLTPHTSANWAISAISCRTANRRCGSCTRSTKFLS